MRSNGANKLLIVAILVHVNLTFVNVLLNIYIISLDGHKLNMLSVF